jgi:hypothetical protein
LRLLFYSNKIEKMMMMMMIKKTRSATLDPLPWDGKKKKNWKYE